MESLAHDMLSNAVVVSLLTIAVAVLGRILRRPAWIHTLCLLAILKLVTPPIVPVALPQPWPVAPAVAESAPLREPLDVPPAPAADLEDEGTERLDVRDPGPDGGLSALPRG